MIEKEFIPYQEALALKELGFNEPCLGSYCQTPKFDEGTFELGNSYTVKAPLYSQAFRWFREKYNILANVYSNASGFLYEWHDTIGGTHRGWSEYEGPNDSGVWDSYEEAELECLRKLIELVQVEEINRR